MCPADPAPDAADAPGVIRRPIPRPPDNRPGAPAPWSGVPEERRRGLSLDRVREALDLDLSLRPEPLAEPWSSLATVPRSRPAAVLAALFEEEGEGRVVLTVRSDQLRSHTGEVAFPGGRIEEGESVVEAALREADEEVGLDPTAVTVIGQLTPRPTISSGALMTPVVATLAARPQLRASPDEVERIFDVALSELAADGVFHEEWWSVPGRPGAPGLPTGTFPVWFFGVAGETVWGATARTLVELLCLVVGVPLPGPLRAG